MGCVYLDATFRSPLSLSPTGDPPLPRLASALFNKFNLFFCFSAHRGRSYLPTYLPPYLPAENAAAEALSQIRKSGLDWTGLDWPGFEALILLPLPLPLMPSFHYLVLWNCAHYTITVLYLVM
jgi:hypothetical protein